jgi:hypothetical protein
LAIGLEGLEMTKRFRMPPFLPGAELVVNNRRLADYAKAMARKGNADAVAALIRVSPPDFPAAEVRRWRDAEVRRLGAQLRAALLDPIKPTALASLLRTAGEWCRKNKEPLSAEHLPALRALPADFGLR